MTKYVNAKQILPDHLVKEIQKYVQGKHLYIPRAERKPWGTETGARDQLRERNREIISMYRSGIDIPKLAELFFLSEDRIESIIYESEVD